MKIEEFQRLGKNVKVIIRKFTENPGKFASVVLQMYWDIEKERDSYKQQRNELINDIAKLRERNAELEHDNKSLRLQANIYFDKWADSMGKAFAFEKVERCIAWFEENDRYEFEGQILEIQQIINELEANND
ncbi:hypothetical protein [Streptomyces sp. NPDC003996]